MRAGAPSGIEMESIGHGAGYGFALKKNDPVNSPAHYTQGEIECIEFLEDQELTHHEASAVAYICRARFKGTEVED